MNAPPLVNQRRRSRAPARRIACLALVWTACGAGGGARAVWVHELGVTTPPPPTLHARDTLLVEVRDQPSLSGEFVVRDDGHYLQPTLGSVEAAGRSPAEVARTVTARLAESKIVADPRVSVWIVRTAPIRVSVVGEVRNPGSHELNRDRTVLTALALAGWLTEFAARNRVFVIRSAAPDVRVRFRVQDLTASEPHSAAFRLADGDVVVVE